MGGRQTSGDSSWLTEVTPWYACPLPSATRMTRCAMQSSATAHCPSADANSHSSSRPCAPSIVRILLHDIDTIYIYIYIMNS